MNLDILRCCVDATDFPTIFGSEHTFGHDVVIERNGMLNNMQIFRGRKFEYTSSPLLKLRELLSDIERVATSTQERSTTMGDTAGMRLMTGLGKNTPGKIYWLREPFIMTWHDEGRNRLMCCWIAECTVFPAMVENNGT